MEIRLGHSPDPDDAFMFWALASGEVDPRRFEFEHVLRDIQTLNTWALDGKLEVSAISLAAYPLVQDKYVLLPHGASMGSGYGPIVVAREELSLADARDVEIAVPGELTTAFLVLRMCLGEFRYRAVPFDQIIEEVQSGRAAAGLLIHEGQLTHTSRRASRRSSTWRVVAAGDGPSRCRWARTWPAAPRRREPVRAVRRAARVDPGRA
jgi:1,4-dihydroxy-6-naphthoate synthase